MILNISEEELRKCNGWSYENIYFFVMMIYLGMANGYTQVLCYPPSMGLWTFFIPIILTAKLVSRNIRCFSNIQAFMKVILILSLWILLHFIKYQNVEPMCFFLLYNVGMAFVICRVYGMRAFVMYEKCLVRLAIISLFVWALYTIMPFGVDFIFSLFGIKSHGTLLWSGFFCNIASSSDFLGVRNVGFAQEPGHWASFLILGIFINLLIHDFNYRNKSFIILLLALITSQSTTGYSAFFFIVVTIILMSARHRLFLVIVSALIIPSIIALPFMREKMEKYAYSEDSIDMIQYNGDYIEKEGGEAVFVPQRFDGFVLEALNFINDPIIGYGVKETNSYVAKTISPYVSCSNGNVKVFSRYGVILGFLFFIMLYRSGKELTVKHSKRISLSWIGIYVLLGMSYEFTTIPLLLSFWGMSYFKKNYY